MKNLICFGFFVFSFSMAAAEEFRAKIYECSQWADGTYNLYCGGAFIKKFKTSLECVQGRKKICGSSATDFECNRWADDTYNLFCDGAFIKKYPNAIACVQGKRELCD